MAGFQRLPRHRDIAGAVERVIGAADLVGARFGHVDEVRHEVLADVLRIDEVGHAKPFAPRLAVGVDVDADDHVGARELEALQHVEPDTAKPEHDRFRTLLDLGGIDDGADPGGDAAADVADLVERGVLADLCYRDLRQHGVVGEGRGTHVVVDRFPSNRETRRAVRHQALPLRGVDRGAEVGLARQAGRALPAFRRVERDDVIAFLDAGHALADVNHDSRALVPEDCREQASGSAPESVNSSVWQTPVALISTITSPSRGPSSWTVVISSGFPAAARRRREHPWRSSFLVVTCLLSARRLKYAIECS